MKNNKRTFPTVICFVFLWRISGNEKWILMCIMKWWKNKNNFVVHKKYFIPLCMWFLSYHTWEETQCLQVLQYITVLGGDQHHVQLFQRLVDVADTLRLHKCVLFASVHQFGKSGQQTLHSRPCHLHKLPWHQGLTCLGADCCCQQHLE